MFESGEKFMKISIEVLELFSKIYLLKARNAIPIYIRYNKCFKTRNTRLTHMI